MMPNMLENMVVVSVRVLLSRAVLVVIVSILRNTVISVERNRSSYAIAAEGVGPKELWLVRRGLAYMASFYIRRKSSQ